MPNRSNPDEATPARPLLDSVERTVRILRVFDSGQELSLAEIARATTLSEATALRYLSSLCHFGLVQRTPASRYRLGWEMFRLGQLAVGDRVPRELVLPIMERLVEQFGETVNLAIREADDVVIVEVLQGTRGLRRVNEVGQRDPWHASSLGKAMLAQMPPAECRALLDRHPLVRLTEATLVDEDAFERDLAETRERGYAVDREEVEDDVTCVASAVAAPNGQPWFALSVSFITHRLQNEDVAFAGKAIYESALELERLLARGAHAHAAV